MRLLMLLLWVLTLSACAKSNRYDDLQLDAIHTDLTTSAAKPAATKPLLTRKPQNNPFRIALAFGGGGARGLQHLGVIRALAEAGIEADLVTGSSVGSIAAAFYASGMSAEQMHQAVHHLNEWEIADPVLNPQGLFNGQALGNWVNQLTGNARVENMVMPLGIAVTDLVHDKAMYVTAGNLGHAVQASSSVPGSVIPVQSHGLTLVDGGILALVPVRLARQLGADFVIGVEIYCGDTHQLKQNGLDTMLNTFRLQACLINQTEIGEADVLIRPAYKIENVLSLQNKEAAIAAGYQAGLHAIPVIKKSLAQRARQ